MNRKLLMSGSALFLGLCGAAALFLPQELLAWSGASPLPSLTVLVQLFAALLLAFGITNWMARESAIGGIYNRPIALGNLMHFAIGAITLIKSVAAGGRTPPLLIAAVAYSVFAVAFGAVVFGRSPMK